MVDGALPTLGALPVTKKKQSQNITSPAAVATAAEPRETAHPPRRAIPQKPRKQKNPLGNFFCFRLDRDDFVLQGGDLSCDGHVDEPGAVLAVGDDEAAEEGGVNLGLELDVLGTRHLLDLLGDHELLLVLEFHGRSHGGDLEPFYRRRGKRRFVGKGRKKKGRRKRKVSDGITGKGRAKSR